MIAGLIMAAGASRRMQRNKLGLPLDGKPILVHVADATLAAGLAPILVVTGHQPDLVQGLLAGRGLQFVHNPDYQSGMASSLKAGIAALPAEAEAVLVCLGDMPRVGAAEMKKLVEAHRQQTDKEAWIPTWQGEWGNPVLLSRFWFAGLMELEGDRGARGLLAARPEKIAEIPMDTMSVLADVDTLEAYLRIGGKAPS